MTPSDNRTLAAGADLHTRGALRIPQAPPQRAAHLPAAQGLDCLLKLAAKGEEQAFAALYDATAPYLYALALNVVGEPVQAQRATQQGFAMVWRYSARHDNSLVAALPWMAAIVHGVAAAQPRLGLTARTPRQPNGFKGPR